MAHDHPVLWSPEAEEDLIAIWQYGALEFSANLADRHLRGIQNATLLLETSPFAGRTRDDIRLGLRSLIIYPTVLFYRVRSNQVEVVRVVDGRRDLAAIFAGEY